MMKPRKVPHDRKGLCENCGRELGASAWIYGESTGCSKKCVIAAEDGDAFEEEQGGLFAMADVSTRGW